MEITDLVHASTPWLTLLVVIPALAAALVGFVRPLRERGRAVALGVSLVELVLAVVAATGFDWSTAGTYQLVETASWIPQIGVSWALGVNALGLVMVLLATALVPLVLLAGWREDEGGDEGGSYAALVLLLEAFMVLIFAAFDVVVFYIAFEAMLIPLYFMIGRFGVGDPERRRAAALKFLLYSLAGGLAMLGGLVALWALAPERSDTLFRLDTASQVVPGLSSGVQMGVFVSFMIAFAIKAPMVPVHTWLPDTAAASRPGTSVLLVGVLDKIGTFGMITLCLRLFPDAASQARWVLCALAVLSILWGGLAAIGQKDLMRLVSYTSVSHFGFMVLGIFIGSSVALTGAMFYMVAHGVSIAAMFLVSGFLTERGGSREIASYGGFQRVTPLIAGTWLVAGLASIALPGLSGFVPEYLVLVGTYSVNVPLAVLAVLGVILAALYVLLPYQKLFTGPKPQDRDVPDMDVREKTVVTPLIAAMAVLGIWSAPLVGALTPVAEDSVVALSAASAQASASHTVSAPAAADEGSTK
ncbi:NADH-quinone oxidoreductase subunit M [Actinomyces polynesiensis]|uniref:NADH-quinone oxidoreductase subunit M n=1 Tax=Actinomyces polynesiensis TaxID=1325934 RepID=UPI0005BDD37C|nr:NADH-quinone oxidoreductase subunit M [Actinomyces polynesiensis]